MIYTAHFDEAASHGANPNLTMGALLGNAYEWGRCELRLQRLQNKYGFTIFHATEFKAHKGEFRGWSDMASRGLVFELTDLIRDTLTEGVTVSLPREQYLAEYRAPPIPPKMILDSQYGICFRACLSHLADLLLTGRNSGKKHTLNIVIEDGHANVGDAGRIFNDVKVSLEERGHHLLGTFAVASKHEAPLLMMADFLAHSHYLMDLSAAQGGPSYRDTSERVPIRPREAGLTFMQLQPGALKMQKQRWEDEKQRKVNEWRAARDARRNRNS